MKTPTTLDALSEYIRERINSYPQLANSFWNVYFQIQSYIQMRPDLDNTLLELAVERCEELIEDYDSITKY